MLHNMQAWLTYVFVHIQIKADYIDKRFFLEVETTAEINV
jgi:hypothetical protein